MDLPDKTVERLIRCKRELLKFQYVDKPHVFSSDLARILNIKPEQLRQDLMATGISSGSNRKGYDVNKLIKAIDEKIQLKKLSKIAFFGEAHLVDIFQSFIECRFTHFEIEAIFSFTKTEDFRNGIPCYSMDKISDVIKEKNIEIAIITVCPEFIVEIAESLLLYDIKGIINLTLENLPPMPGVFVENCDILSTVEKLNYFIKESQ